MINPHNLNEWSVTKSSKKCIALHLSHRGEDDGLYVYRRWRLRTPNDSVALHEASNLNQWFVDVIAQRTKNELMLMRLITSDVYGTWIYTNMADAALPRPNIILASSRYATVHAKFSCTSVDGASY